VDNQVWLSENATTDWPTSSGQNPGVTWEKGGEQFGELPFLLKVLDVKGCFQYRSIRIRKKQRRDLI
jgi:hypothetical protein